MQVIFNVNSGFPILQGDVMGGRAIYYFQEEMQGTTWLELPESGGDASWRKSSEDLAWTHTLGVLIMSGGPAHTHSLVFIGSIKAGKYA